MFHGLSRLVQKMFRNYFLRKAAFAGLGFGLLVNVGRANAADFLNLEVSCINDPVAYKNVQVYSSKGVINGKTDTLGKCQIPLNFFESVSSSSPSSSAKGISHLFPNPSSGESALNISVMQTGDIEIEQYNLLGQKLSSRSYHVASGTYRLNVFSGNTGKGMQFVNVIFPNGESRTEKITFLDTKQGTPKLSRAGDTVNPVSIDSIVVSASSASLGDNMARYVLNKPSVTHDLEILIPPAYFDAGFRGIVSYKSMKVNGGKVSLTVMRGNELSIVNGTIVNGQINLIAPVGENKIYPEDQLEFIQLRLSGETKLGSGETNFGYINDQVFVLNLPAKGLTTEVPYELLINEIFKAYTLKGSTSNVFGEGISVDDIIAYLTVDGKIDSAKTSSDSLGNFNLVYPSGSSSIANVDSVVFKGKNIPRQSIKVSKPLSDIVLGDITLDRFANVKLTIYDVLKYSPELGLNNLRVGLANGAFIGKSQSFPFTTGLNGEIELVLPLGDYDLDLSASGYRDSHPRVAIKDIFSQIEKSMIKRETTQPDTNLYDQFGNLNLNVGMTTMDGMTDREMELLAKYGKRFEKSPKVAIDTTGLGSKANTWVDITKTYLNRIHPLFKTILTPEGFFDFSNIELLADRVNWLQDNARKNESSLVFFYYVANRGNWGGTGSDTTSQGALRVMGPSFNSTLPDTGFWTFKGVADTMCVGYREILPHEVSGLYSSDGRPRIQEYWVSTAALWGTQLWSLRIGTEQPFDIKEAKIVYSRPPGYLRDLILKDQDPDYGKPKIGPSKAYDAVAMKQLATPNNVYLQQGLENLGK